MENVIQLPENFEIDKVENGKIYLKEVKKIPFNDGDFLADMNDGLAFIYNGKHSQDNTTLGAYIGLCQNNLLSIREDHNSKWINTSKVRKATEDEKRHLLTELNKYGYVWNTKTNQLIALPKSWEAFCKVCPRTEDDFYIDTNSSIETAESPNTHRFISDDRNCIKGKENAEAFLALMQLIQLRDYYRQGWKPDWANKEAKKFVISFSEENLICIKICNVANYIRGVLAFPSLELSHFFKQNFEELIRIAEPLL